MLPYLFLISLNAFVLVPDRSMIRSNLLAVHRNPLYCKFFSGKGDVFHAISSSSRKIFSIRINGESSEIGGGSSTSGKDVI